MLSLSQQIALTQDRGNKEYTKRLLDSSQTTYILFTQ